MFFFVAFVIISHNAHAQTNNTIENYQPPPMFGAPKLPPPKLKKPKVDVIPDISKPVEQPITNNAPIKTTKPRVVKEIKDVQTSQENETQSKSFTPKPSLEKSTRPATKPILQKPEDSLKDLPPQTVEQQKNKIVKPSLLQKSKTQDLQNTEEPIDFLKQQPLKKQENPVQIKKQGVVKGPKTMPSYKKKSVEAEQTFIPQTSSENMLDRVQKDNAVVPSPPLKEKITAQSQPSTISQNQNKFTFLYKTGQIKLSETEFLATLKPLAQLLEQNNKIIEIKSYASLVNGKINSDRRTALDRGLFIRDYLISKNIEPFRINLRSFGEQSEKSQKDWVEINLVD